LSSVTTRTHYSVLGIHDGASQESIREAYRRLAREFHPDRTGGSATGGEKMPAINEAYRVLSDPARRAVYDASLRGGTSATSEVASAASARSSEEPGDEAMREWRYQHPEGPARIPWRSLSFFSLIAIVGIVVLSQFSEPGEPGVPDGILRNGDCVEVLPNNLVGEVACAGEGDLVVRQFIAFDRVCSNGWTAYQDRQGMGVACVEARPTPAS
jgi:molecular chaperone DnaJ